MSRLPALALSAGGLLLGSAGAALYRAVHEPRTLQLHRYRVQIPGMPAALDGARVVFLTDFHLNGPGFGTALTRPALELAEAQRPDLVLLGGDYCDRGRWEGQAAVFDQLAALPPTYGVLGNHDFAWRGVGIKQIVSELERRGVHVLRNRSEDVCLRGQRIVVAGVDDPYTARDDLEDALAGGWPLFLLAHAPSVVEKIPLGGAGLVLAGHTHGAQVRTSPFDTLTPLDSTWYLDRIVNRPAQRYVRRFHWVRGALLFVSNGIGTTRWPLRVFAPPEVVLLELTAEPPHPGEPCDRAARYVEDLGVTSC